MASMTINSSKSAPTFRKCPGYSLPVGRLLRLDDGEGDVAYEPLPGGLNEIRLEFPIMDEEADGRRPFGRWV